MFTYNGGPTVTQNIIAILYYLAAGMEKHSSVPSVYYRDAVGLLLVYDISQPKSQGSVKKWREDASATVMMKDGRPLPAVLLANKVLWYVSSRI